MAHTSNRTPDSIKVYTKLGLRVYDALVMNLFPKYVWGCTSGDLVNHYRQHVTSNHADIGVGTGYCLDHCGFDLPTPRLALIDLQSNCLRYTARRLSRYQPSTYVHNVLQPIGAIPGGSFDSIAMGGVLHCLAGDLREKGKAFDTIAMLARSGTKIFGYSLVSDHVHLRRSTRIVHGLLNRLRIIDNTSDHESDLRRELSNRFIDCRVESIGCMALFSAVVPDAKQ